jgi:hypothetical protein
MLDMWGFFTKECWREHIFFGSTAGELMITLPRVEGKIDESGPIKSVLIDPDKFYVVVERDIREYVNSLRDLSMWSFATISKKLLTSDGGLMNQRESSA